MKKQSSRLLLKNDHQLFFASVQCVRANTSNDISSFLFCIFAAWEYLITRSIALGAKFACESRETGLAAVDAAHGLLVNRSATSGAAKFK